MLKLRTILLYDYLYYILVFLVLIYSVSSIKFKPKTSLYNGMELEVTGYIHDFTINGDHLKLELRGLEKLLVNYYFKSKEVKETWDLELGDEILVKGNLKEPTTNRVFNLFNYKEYLNYHQVYYLMSAETIIKIKDNSKLRYKLKGLILNRINQIKNVSPYLKTFILGDKSDLKPQVMTSYQTNGVSHLLAISGLHVSFLAGIILYLLKRFKVQDLSRYLVVFIFLLIYLFLTDFTGSVLRATVFFILLALNKIFCFQLQVLNVLLLTLVLLLGINPYLLYDLSFQFSFSISFYLILGQKLIIRSNSYLGKLLIVSMIAFLASIPLCSYNFFQINLLSPSFNLLFVPFVTFLLFPLAFITFLLPFFSSLYLLLIKLMEFISLWLSTIKIGIIILAKPTLIIIILYYVFLFISLKSKNKVQVSAIILFVLLTCGHTYYNTFIKDPYLVFLDVGQGDATLINLERGRGTILVDTGGIVDYPKEEWALPKNEYSLATSLIIPYLKSMGIKALDYLIITHGHYDHMGEALNLINNFKVKKIVFNGVSLTALEKELIKNLALPSSRLLRVKAGDVIKLGGNSFYVLNPVNNLNPNDNSIVLYTKLNHYQILLTGDITTKIESNLINTYNLKELDILKVAHHGSFTSSDLTFIQTTKPKYGVISVGLKNKFDHPHPATMSKLKAYQVKTYLTSEHGTIKFNLTPNQVTIKPCYTYDKLEH